ncbi:hypothetical protein SDJN02_19562, partial [Cucurbita argyrosperma subsp. argyrosperma]
MAHNLAAVSFHFPQLIINRKCHQQRHCFRSFAVKNNNNNHQNPPIFSLRFSTFHPLFESPNASFDEYIGDEDRLLRATFSGKSEKLNKGEWRVEMPSFQLLFLKLSPVVDVRLSCKSSTKDYPIHIPRHVSKFLDLQMMRWEVRGMGKDFKPQMFRISVKGAMYAIRTESESKSILRNHLILDLHSFDSPIPTDFLQPFAEKIHPKQFVPDRRDFTMPYYTRDDEAVDDFDEYDPTPYGGGFDLFLTYGRPISPCEDTCYPHSAGNDDEFDYERPQFESNAQPSAYGDDALQAEYSSYSRPKPHSYCAPPRPVEQEYGSGGYESARPQPAYGYQQSGSEYGSEGYGRKSESEQQEYGSGGYRRKQESESYGSEEYGSGGYGRKQESESYGSGGYGRKQESESYGSGGYGGRQESDSYGSGGGYGRKQESDSYGSGGYGGRQESDSYGSGGYGGRQESDSYGSGGGYGRKQESDSYGSGGYGRRQESESYGSGGGYGRREEGESESYGSGGYRRQSESEEYGSGRKQSYGEEEGSGGYGKQEYESSGYRREKYERPNYGDEERMRPSYGRSEEEDYRKPSYAEDEEREYAYGEEGYGRKKYGGDSDEDSRRHHHHRRNYEDE